MNMHIEQSMFRSYDIRGLYEPDGLNEYTAYVIAKALGTFFQEKRITRCITGYDAREYSESIKDSVVKGLVESGIHVTDIGLCTTPMGYFAQHYLGGQALAIVTASHNPNGWAGIKMCWEPGKRLAGKDIQELRKRVEQEQWKKGIGSSESTNILPAYLDALRKHCPQNMKVVVNGRHGIAGNIAAKFLKDAGMDVVEQFCDIDMTYPQGTADPSEAEMMKEVGEKVRETGADIGIALDADGDRLGVTDEKGNSVTADRILALVAGHTIQPGDVVVCDVKCSQGVEEWVKGKGGKTVMVKTGSPYIEQAIQKHCAVVGGERSGHLFITKNHYGYDDGLVAACTVFSLLSQEKRPLSALVEELPTYYTSPVFEPSCGDDRTKKEVLEQIVADLKKQYPDALTLDGIRISFPQGWVLIRCSSNMPVLSIVCEGTSPQALGEMIAFVKKTVKKYPHIQWK